MSKQKSWGGSTKSTSLFFSASPKRIEPKNNNNQELSFLLLKNKELQQRTLRMAQYINTIEKEKKQLLSLNHRYVEALNQQFRNSHGLFQQESKKVKKNSLTLCKHCNRDILTEFQRDYRNLVKYCSTLEDQIASKNLELQRFNQMKRELLEAQHDSVRELAKELFEVTQQLVQVRKDSNKIQFQNEKIKREYERNKKGDNSIRVDLQRVKSQNQNFKSLINTIQNESKDKEDSLCQKIYQLELKIERLEKELRKSEELSRGYRKRSEELRMQQIELVYSSQDEALRKSAVTSSLRGSKVMII